MASGGGRLSAAAACPLARPFPGGGGGPLDEPEKDAVTPGSREGTRLLRRPLVAVTPAVSAGASGAAALLCGPRRRAAARSCLAAFRRGVGVS